MKKATTLILTTILSFFAFTACDDDTAAIGGSIIPDSDRITVDTLTVYAKSRSLLANDSILANSSNVYLGRYTDPETGTIFTSDFIAQFNCVEGYGFPDEGVIEDSATNIELKLFFNSYFGDSLNTMQCEVYELSNTLQEGKPYYTNLDPTTFYDASKAPIATKSYCIIDNTVPDSISMGDNYTRSITVRLPDEIGKRFIDKYYETDANGDSIGKINFSNSEEFINNVFKGLYVKSSKGDGTVAYISMARLNVEFHYPIKRSGKPDSIATGIATFSSTKEVLQVNKFSNTNLQSLAADNNCTYLKTPAGIFTEVELPISEIMEKTDTLNSVKIAFTRYNRENTGSNFTHTAPSRLLMLRKSELHSFFIKNKLYDGITSYSSTLNTNDNTYTFSNISRLISYCADERDKGITSDPAWESKNPDWNKVVLVPITVTADKTTGNIVSLSHNHSITSTRLRGGKDPIAISIVTSRYKNR